MQRQEWRGTCDAHTLVHVHVACRACLGELGVEEAGREAAELEVRREHLVRLRVRMRVGLR